MIRVAKPGTKIVIADESDKANKYYSIFLGKQEKVVPPVDLIPSGMLDIRLDTIWRGFGYAIDFRTPVISSTVMPSYISHPPYHP
jgi:hypothetical protein